MFDDDIKVIQIAIHGGTDNAPSSLVILYNDGEVWERKNTSNAEWKLILLPHNGEGE